MLRFLLLSSLLLTACLPETTDDDDSAADDDDTPNDDDDDTPDDDDDSATDPTDDDDSAADDDDSAADDDDDSAADDDDDSAADDDDSATDDDDSATDPTDDDDSATDTPTDDDDSATDTPTDDDDSAADTPTDDDDSAADTLTDDDDSAADTLTDDDDSADNDDLFGADDDDSASDDDDSATDTLTDDDDSADNDDLVGADDDDSASDDDDSAASNDDDSAADLTLLDLDGDGFTPADGDCDDDDPLISPAATELCGDATDNDCDPVTIDLVDADGDGAPCDIDCDDTTPLAQPIAFETCGDGIDNDCDPSTPDIFDQDGDGADCDVDCADYDPSRSPWWAEACDGYDNDCDELVDEDFDLDGDGWTTCAGDCDDEDPSVVPVPGDLIVLTFPGGMPIPDGDLDGLQLPVTALTSGLVGDVDVTLDITHPVTGELSLYLHSPAGFSIELAAGVGWGPDFVGTVLDDEAPGDLYSGSNPFSGAFQPALPLSSFDDTDPGGDWILQIVDTTPGGGIGTLDAASLLVTTAVSCEVPPEVDPTADLDGDGHPAASDCDDSEPTTFPGALELCADGVDNDCDPNTADVFDRDYDGDDCTVDCNDWNYGVSTWMFEACDELDNNCNGEVDEGHDLDGDGWTTCAGDCDDFDPSVVPVGGQTWEYLFPAGLPIPDGDLLGLQVDLEVFDPATIRDVDFVLGVTHPSTYELTTVLHAPDGTWVELVAGAGGYGDDFSNTWLDDESILPINQGTPPFDGVFVPGMSLYAFDNLPAAGVWTLQVVDTVPSPDVGTLDEARLVITTFGECVLPF